MNMSTHEILLSMMIIILCSAPRAELANEDSLFGKGLNQVQCVNGIYLPGGCDETKIITNNAEETGKLTIVYIVDGTDKYDEMFENLADSHQSTVFLKIDKTQYVTHNSEQLDAASLPKIVFYKFGNIKEEFSTFEKHEIENKIKSYEALTVKYEDGIYVPENDGEAKKIKYDAEETGKLSVMYIVDNTDEYDNMFKNLADNHQSTVFMKIDKTQYVTENSELLNATSLPKIVLYKFGKIRETFHSTQVNEIEEKIRSFEKLQVEYRNGIYVPKDSGETKKIIKDAEKTGKLSVIYIVENDGDDGTIINLAEKHQSTVFIKIDKTQYDSENSKLLSGVSESNVILYKSGDLKGKFSSTDKDEIEEKIRYFE